MGIEPTWDFVEPHTGFEDQERHRAASHLQTGWPRRLPLAGVIVFRRAVSHQQFDRLNRKVQADSLASRIIRNGLY